jgi:carbonic anhydrase
MISAAEALERLRQGNRRFAVGAPNHDGVADARVRAELVAGQEPFAVILGCSDSRVPAEIVFDQGMGELFVVRVAGNVASSSQIASVEFAAGQFGTRLVVVLGHSRCGAVAAALEVLSQPESEPRSPDLRALLDLVRPSIEPWLASATNEDPDTRMERAVRSNIRNSVERLRKSALLAPLIENDGLCIVGGEYSLETGRVEFFEGVPVAGRAS